MFIRSMNQWMGAAFGLVAGAVMLASSAVAGSVVIQVQVDLLNEGDRCSLLEVSSTGEISELASHGVIRQGSGSTSCDFNDTGIAGGLEGWVYYADDTDSDIKVVDVAGNILTLVSESALDDLIGEANDIDSGMVFGQDGHLYVADEDCNCLIKVSLSADGATATGLEILVSEAEFEAGGQGADPEGGMVRMPDGTFYLTNDATQGIFRVQPDGTVDFWVSQADIGNVLGSPYDGSLDLDVGMTAVGSNLYVMDDDSSSLFRISTTDPTDMEQLFDQLEAMEAIDGPGTVRSGISVEGGLAYNPDTNTFFVPVDTSDFEYRDAYILEVTLDGEVSVLVDNAALMALYTARYGENIRVDFGGSATYRTDPRPVQIDATSTWSLWVLMLVLLAGAGVVLGRRL